MTPVSIRLADDRDFLIFVPASIREIAVKESTNIMSLDTYKLVQKDLSF